jgi:hypothetical protein
LAGLSLELPFSPSSATQSFSSWSALKRSASLPSRSDSTSDATPRTSGHRAMPRRPSTMARSRTWSEPSRRRTTTANDLGARIITPSRTA